MNYLNPKRIAAALGGDITVNNEVRAPGPGKRPADRSLLVQVEPYESQRILLIHSFANDSFETCRDYVDKIIGSANCSLIYPMPLSDISLRWWWNEARDIRGTLAERYIRSLGLIPDELRIFEEICKQIRFHPSCPFESEHHPCLLELERNIFNDKPEAVIRTALDPEGRKLGRLVIAGTKCAVKLCGPSDFEKLTIGEGLETALGGIAAGFRPVWSVSDENKLRMFPDLPRVNLIRILANNESDVARLQNVFASKDWKFRLGRKKIDLVLLENNQRSDGNLSIGTSVITQTPKRQKRSSNSEVRDKDELDLGLFFE